MFHVRGTAWNRSEAPHRNISVARLCHRPRPRSGHTACPVGDRSHGSCNRYWLKRSRVEQVPQDCRRDRSEDAVGPTARLSDRSSVTDIPIPGGWTQQPVLLAERSFQVIQPREPDELLEELARREDVASEPDPYWARLWPCAITMAKAVLQADWPAAGEVLEIGCGIGLVGLAALARGLTVTFSDHVPLAVSLAVENAERNGFSARGLLLDWDCPLPQRYGVILGSDVIYDRRCHDRLLTLLEQMLTPGGICWLGDPGRTDAQRFVERGSAARVSRADSGRERDGNPHRTHGALSVALSASSDSCASRSVDSNMSLTCATVWNGTDQQCSGIIHRSKPCRYASRA